MIRIQDFDEAREEAEKQGCAFGLSVVDPCYYVGPKVELDKLPVVIQCDYAAKAEGKEPSRFSGLRSAYFHLVSVRRAGPEFTTPARYSFTNENDSYEVERAIELLYQFLTDIGELE